MQMSIGCRRGLISSSRLFFSSFSIFMLNKKRITVTLRADFNRAHTALHPHFNLPINGNSPNRSCKMQSQYITYLEPIQRNKSKSIARAAALSTIYILSPGFANKMHARKCAARVPSTCPITCERPNNNGPLLLLRIREMQPLYMRGNSNATEAPPRSHTPPPSDSHMLSQCIVYFNAWCRCII